MAQGRGIDEQGVSALTVHDRPDVGELGFLSGVEVVNEHAGRTDRRWMGSKTVTVKSTRAQLIEKRSPGRGAVEGPCIDGCDWKTGRGDLGPAFCQVMTGARCLGGQEDFAGPE